MQMGRENGPDDAGHLRRIDTLFFEGFYDDVTGFPLIFTVDFCVGHFAGAGNGAVEIVGVGGTGCWNRLTRLRPDGGVARVCVHNAANGRECLIEQPVSWRVGGGLFRTFNHFTGFNADHDHIVSSHDAVIDAGRFDHQDAALAINGADIAPCERDRVVFWQRRVGF